MKNGISSRQNQEYISRGRTGLDLGKVVIWNRLSLLKPFLILSHHFFTPLLLSQARQHKHILVAAPTSYNIAFAQAIYQKGFSMIHAFFTKLVSFRVESVIHDRYQSHENWQALIFFSPAAFQFVYLFKNFSIANKCSLIISFFLERWFWMLLRSSPSSWSRFPAACTILCRSAEGLIPRSW